MAELHEKPVAEVAPKNALPLALQLHQAGRLPEAERLYRQVLAREPGNAVALHYLGLLAHQSGHGDVAVELIRRAIAVSPGYAEAHNNLGNAMIVKQEYEDALACYRQAIALEPNYFQAHSNLGIALRRTGRIAEAIAACRTAIALRPDHAEAHNALGVALIDAGQTEEAIGCYRRAVALKPDCSQFHYNLGYRLLSLGQFSEGWQEYEWRWKCNELALSCREREFARPQWDGGPLEGRTILLHAEQGLGDTMQFIRYVPMVAARGGKIVVECAAELHRLFQSLGDCTFVVRGQPLPPFDVHCPLLTLPRMVGTMLASIPKNVPYLRADPELVEAWRRRLPVAEGGPRIALTWAGNPGFPADRTRSLSLDRLAPLAGAQVGAYYSLQKGDAARQIDHPPTALRLINLGPGLRDFADTAAVMSLMDLVITTDTSAAHLAGALGRPVWVTLQYVPDWRWLLRREDSPWYPTMRLFRQPALGDWESVIQRLADTLRNRLIQRAN